MLAKRTKGFALLLVLVLVLSQLSAFATVEEAYAVKITGVGVATELHLTIADMKAMPAEAQIDEAYIYNSKAGEKSVHVKGVSLAYVLTELAGVTADNAEVSFTASDAYPIDPQMLQDVLDPELKYVLAYEIDGELIDNDGIAENEEIVVYRKLKEAGEFGTVYKMVVTISVGEATEIPVEPEPEEEGEAIEFTDITEEFTYAEMAIQELAKKGIINGMGNGLYAPAGSLTRAQISKIMVESLGYQQVEYKGGFSDVDTSDWFAGYVQAAVDAGIFVGYPDGTFKPDQVISRQEMAVVAARGAIDMELVTPERVAKFVMEKSAYLDKDAVPEWAANEVAWLEAQGVFAEIAVESFEPVKVINRAEAAVIVFNTLFK
ncbi:MAG: S-layer homology domain-containing protein [Eubacteriales bacterium]|nr:S-layer homology domain-containing protein [Eubacteriales bacterium]